MADTDTTWKDAETQLFRRLHAVRAGMLSLENSSLHARPMTHYLDEAGRVLHFITARDTDLVRALGQGATARFTIQAPEEDYYACLTGTLRQSEDTDKLDEVWTRGAAAWFEEGRDDPKIVLLEMPLRDAAIWATTDNAVVFGLEVTRAALGEKSAPDVGAQVLLDFTA